MGKIRLSLSNQIFIGLVLGILVGLFFGEMAAWLNILGEAFLRLFQMPVIPYIVISLIGSLGRLNYQEAKSIFLKGGAVILLFWAITLVVVLVFPLGFPNWKSASFFSTSLLEDGQPISLIELFIPFNPFSAMANTVIPSVVMFSIALGLAIIPLPNKQGLIEVLSNLTDALMKITQFVAKLTPIGVFAIAANAAGTLPFEAFGRLQVYVVLQAAIALLLSFWVLPGLIAALTPLRYGEVVAAYRTPLITAFATANLLIVLPLIIDRSRELLSRIDRSPDRGPLEIDSPLEVLVPISFTFPSMGKLLSLAFIPFAAWYNGSSFPVDQYPTFLLAGLASFFGDGIVAMRFLLNLLAIPSDMLQLYITLDQVSAARFGTLLAGMNTIALALLATCAINGLIRVRRRQLVRFGTVTVLLVALILGSNHAFFTYGVTNAYTKDKVLANLQLLRVRNPQSAEVFREPPPPLPLYPEQPSRLMRIRERGILRVCYIPDDYPLSYFNHAGELVGFDMEMAHILTRDLGVGIEFVPTPKSFRQMTESQELAKALDRGYCDLLMSAAAITPERAELVNFSIPFQNYTLAFLVPDRRRDRFSSWAKLQQLGPLRIGSTASVPYYEAKLRGLLPEAELVPLESAKQFLESDREDIDALVVTAENGSAWTLLYPEYSIAIPKPTVAVPVAYAMPSGDQQLANVVNAWLALKQQDGTIKSLFDYWIQGKVEAVQPPRWSIIRDVLHWVE